MTHDEEMRILKFCRGLDFIYSLIWRSQQLGAQAMSLTTEEVAGWSKDQVFQWLAEHGYHWDGGWK